MQESHGKGRILFFAPDAGLVPHFLTHCAIARTFKERGFSVLLTRCHGLFQRCVVMASRQMPFAPEFPQRQQVCSDCLKSSLQFSDSYGLPSLDLKDFFTPEVQQRWLETIKNLPANLQDARIDDLLVGKLSLIELIPAKKIIDFVNLD